MNRNGEGVAEALVRHGRRYPCMEPQDAVKLLYQRFFGSGHLLADEEAGLSRLREEALCADAADTEPELLGGGTVRLPLGLVSSGHLEAEWLFRMFLFSARETGDKAGFLQALVELETVTAAGQMPFSADALASYLHPYREAGCPMVSHSGRYRDAYRPSYRIADERFLRALPVLERWRTVKPRGSRGVIAVDGRCASGKTTVAELLSFVLKCPVIHMDDFFLPPEMRTAERYGIPGGNVHAERFLEEVIPHIGNCGTFAYGRFDCSRPSEPPAPCTVAPGYTVIVEGSYAMHPRFGSYADMTVFSDVTPEEQWRRIRERNGSFAPVFREKWIPLEEAYFEATGVCAKASVLLL